MPALRYCIVAATLSFLLLPVGCARQSEQVTLGETLVFEKGRSVYSLNKIGAKPKKLATIEGDALLEENLRSLPHMNMKLMWTSAVSPSGKKLFLTESKSGLDEYWPLNIFDLESRRMKTLFLLGGDDDIGQLQDENGRFVYAGDDVREPAWDSKSERIAFIGIRLIVVNATNGHKAVLADNVGPFGKEGPNRYRTILSPSWGPDVNSVFFHDTENLVEMGLDRKVVRKTPLRRMTGNDGGITIDDRFIVSPVSTGTIAYTQKKSLFAYDAKRKKRRQLASGLAIDKLSWSPGGRRLYFSARQPSGSAAKEAPTAIYRINSDGVGMLKIVEGENPTVAR